MMRAFALAGCGVLALATSGCESTEEQSARIGREAVKLTASKGTVAAGATNSTVRASHVTLLQSAGRGAVALQLSSSASATQSGVPVLISVVGAAGKVLYSNNVSGLESTLQQMPLLRAHQSAWWVDDQVLTAQTGGHVQVHIGSVRVRSAASNHRSLPDISTSEVHVGTQSGLSVVDGNLVNHAKASVSKVPVFAVALRGGTVTAAGRALVATLPPGTTPFQIFLVGNPTGSTIQISVPAAGA
jgi:hypothetical protein